MSAHGHDHADPHGGAAHGSRKGYWTGFGLSVVLTAIPFALVMSGIIADPRVTSGIVMAFALVQIVVHMVYFLHMNARSENGWTMMALIFTVILVVIAIAGSLWVMFNMNANMMPGMVMGGRREHVMARAAPRRIAFGGALLIAAVLLAALGVWQVERRAWKHRLIETVEARLAAAPAALPPRVRWPALARDGDYTRVRVDGDWLPGAPVFVQAVTVLGPGWWTIGALRTREGSVLVNRGFVPQEARATTMAPVGPAQLTGLVRRDEPGGAFLRHNDPAHGRWYSRDVRAIARARGWRDPAPFFVDAAANGTGWPRGGLTVVRFPDNHLVYALTWFALSGLAGWFAWRVLAHEARA